MPADATAFTAVPQTAGTEPSGCTVEEARRAWGERFAAAGLDSPQLDARLLVGHALGLEHAAVMAAAQRHLSAREEQAIAALAERRLAHEPVTRIIGSKEFWSLELRLNEATLVPRPETETVVEAALAALDRSGPRARRLRIADLGTGSGAILLALLSELRNAIGIGCDISPRALMMARENAQRLRQHSAVPDGAYFVACDLAAALQGPFDLIVSNPPYIASREIAALAPEVRLFDPHLALDGGTDGLHFYRAIAATVPPLLAPGGAITVEIGAGQAKPVTGIFAAAGLAPLPPRPDLNGMPRAIVALTTSDERAAPRAGRGGR
jgi:release factor glutamine methyltransferase